MGFFEALIGFAVGAAVDSSASRRRKISTEPFEITKAITPDYEFMVALQKTISNVNTREDLEDLIAKYDLDSELTYIFSTDPYERNYIDTIVDGEGFTLRFTKSLERKITGFPGIDYMTNKIHTSAEIIAFLIASKSGKVASDPPRPMTLTLSENLYTIHGSIKYRDMAAARTLKVVQDNIRKTGTNLTYYDNSFYKLFGEQEPVDQIPDWQLRITSRRTFEYNLERSFTERVIERELYSPTLDRMLEATERLWQQDYIEEKQRIKEFNERIERKVNQALQQKRG